MQFNFSELPLGTREKEILSLAAEGLADKEIAASLRVGESTVKTFWERIREKLRAHNRAHAVAIALEHELTGRRDRFGAGELIASEVVGIAVLDSSGKIVESNREFLRVLGLTSRARPNILRLIPRKWRKAAGEATEELAKDGFVRPFFIEMRHKDGSLIPLVLGGVRLKGSENRAALYAVSVGAISHLRLAG